jgi:hypothetical protein
LHLFAADNAVSGGKISSNVETRDTSQPLWRARREELQTFLIAASGQQQIVGSDRYTQLTMSWSNALAYWNIWYIDVTLVVFQRLMSWLK